MASLKRPWRLYDWNGNIVTTYATAATARSVAGIMSALTGKTFRARHRSLGKPKDLDDCQHPLRFQTWLRDDLFRCEKCGARWHRDRSPV
jgi:hypothetical protein